MLTPVTSNHQPALDSQLQSMRTMAGLSICAVTLLAALSACQQEIASAWACPAILCPAQTLIVALAITQVYDEMGVHSIMLDAYIEDLLAATETAWGVARSGANIARERPGPWHTRLVICKVRQ